MEYKFVHHTSTSESVGCCFPLVVNVCCVFEITSVGHNTINIYIFYSVSCAFIVIEQICKLHSIKNLSNKLEYYCNMFGNRHGNSLERAGARACFGAVPLSLYKSTQ